MSLTACCAAVTLLLLSRADTADDAAIAALLERMEQAVLAADVPAYLACIDPSEPEWAREQENWAADLPGHTPEAFELDLVSDLGPGESGGSLRADLSLSWRVPGGRDRYVSFPGAFVKRVDTWLFAGEAWQRAASADGQNIVLFLDDDLRPVADKVIDIMPAIRVHVDEGFETRLEHPQVIKLYDDMRHLQQSIYLSYEEPLGGWNEPGEAIKVLSSPGARAGELRVLLAHEYGHVATFTYGPDASKNLPWWVAEGVAELAAERYTGAAATKGVAELLRAWATAGQLAAWDDMADFRQTPAELHPHVYMQGHHFMGYVSERFGRSRRNRWIQLLVAGATLDAASREVFDVPFDQLDRDWRASLEPAPAPSDEG